MFWTKNRCISSVSRTNTNLSNVLSEHPISFELFWYKTRYFSNLFGRNEILFECSLPNMILFECFAEKFNTFRIFWGRNQILIHCFGQNFDTSWMNCSKIRLFVQIFWVETRYKLFENYRSSVQSIEKVFDFDPKHPKNIEFWAKH